MVVRRLRRRGRREGEACARFFFLREISSLAFFSAFVFSLFLQHQRERIKRVWGEARALTAVSLSLFVSFLSLSQDQGGGGRPSGVGRCRSLAKRARAGPFLVFLVSSVVRSGVVSFLSSPLQPTKSRPRERASEQDLGPQETPRAPQNPSPEKKPAPRSSPSPPPPPPFAPLLQTIPTGSLTIPVPSLYALK